MIPIPNDPDWSIFEDLPEDVPVIVVDDSDGNLAPAPRANVRFYNYRAQRDVMGTNYAAISHKSAATRNFGHYLAFTEGFDVIIALDYDCRPRGEWLTQHLAQLTRVVDAPALHGTWINTIEVAGLFARGFPYEYRNAEAAVVSEGTASGDVKLNIGVWDKVLDINAIDRILAEVPGHPGLRGGQNFVAVGNVPVCGMNTAFTSDLTPAYFFLPDVFFEGWQLSRHDDIWGGYVLKKLMDRRGDLVTYGQPIVEHTRQSSIERALKIEHYMHLMSMRFYAIVDEAAASVRAGGYGDMFAEFTERYCGLVSKPGPDLPEHYRGAFVELGQWMRRWVDCFI